MWQQSRAISRPPCCRLSFSSSSKAGLGTRLVRHSQLDSGRSWALGTPPPPPPEPAKALSQRQLCLVSSFTMERGYWVCPPPVGMGPDSPRHMYLN